MGYWYVTPTRQPKDAKYSDQHPRQQIHSNWFTTYSEVHGEFTNNRVHSCYGGLYSDSNADVVYGQLHGLSKRQ